MHKAWKMLMAPILFCMHTHTASDREHQCPTMCDGAHVFPFTPWFCLLLVAPFLLKLWVREHCDWCSFTIFAQHSWHFTRISHTLVSYTRHGLQGVDRVKLLKVPQPSENRKGGLKQLVARVECDFFQKWIFFLFTWTQGLHRIVNTEQGTLQVILHTWRLYMQYVRAKLQPQCNRNNFLACHRIAAISLRRTQTVFHQVWIRLGSWNITVCGCFPPQLTVFWHPQPWSHHSAYKHAQQYRYTSVPVLTKTATVTVTVTVTDNLSKHELQKSLRGQEITFVLLFEACFMRKPLLRA